MSASAQQPTHIGDQHVPHIIDSILDLTFEDDLLNVRPVCKHWRELADKDNARHLALDLSLPPETPELNLDIEDEDDMAPNQTYVWEFSAVKHPMTYVYWPLAHALESVPNPQGAINVKPWVDIQAEARMIDVRDPVEFVGGRISLDVFANLDTVRFQQEKYRSAGFEVHHLLPHVRRVIFSDGPYGEARAHRVPRELPAVDCAVRREGAECSRPHTRKIVVNCRTPVFAHGSGHNIQQGLEELVIIFHGWGVVPRYNREHPDAHGGRPCDARSDVRPLIFTALKAGARVTIVNAELLDFKTGRYRSNVDNGMTLWQEELVADARDTHRLSEEQIGRMTNLSIKEYKARVGEEEWRIETMTDV